MVRKIGYAVGMLLLADGLVSTINPHMGMDLWRRHFRQHMPDTLNEVTEEYSNLSDSALRYFTVWEAVTGIAMVWLASRSRG